MALRSPVWRGVADRPPGVPHSENRASNSCRQLARLPGALTVALGLACGGTADRGWHDDESSPLIVSIGPEAQRQIRLGNLVKVLAPPVEFAGLVVEDRNHYPPVLATASGTVVSIRPKGIVIVGDTLLTARGTAGLFAFVADRGGTWQPRGRDRGVELGDTVGTLGHSGTWIAQGSVGDHQGYEIHPGDPATVRIWGDPDSLIRGTVEWVRRPLFDEVGGSATVGVEFPHAPGNGHGGTSALVTVTPSGPGDSVFAAPEEALVRLSNGLALFIPQGSDRYEVRFVFIGPTIGRAVVLREGAKRAFQVAIQGLGKLKVAAEDSLRLRLLGR